MKKTPKNYIIENDIPLISSTALARWCNEEHSSFNRTVKSIANQSPEAVDGYIRKTVGAFEVTYLPRKAVEFILARKRQQHAAGAAKTAGKLFDRLEARIKAKAEKEPKAKKNGLRFLSDNRPAQTELHGFGDAQEKPKTSVKTAGARIEDVKAKAEALHQEPAPKAERIEAGAIVPFQFDGAKIRVVEIEGEPWFVAADVCRLLEISNPQGVYHRLDEDEKGVRTINTPGGPQRMTIIKEAGVYAFAFKSRKPEAKRFSKWVRNEVLPSIRRTGAYDARAPQAEQPAPKKSVVEAIAALEGAAKFNAEFLGMPHEQAIIGANHFVKMEYGLDYLKAIGHTRFPATTQDVLVTPTYIGEKLGLSAVRVNELLVRLKLIIRYRDESGRQRYRLTAEGIRQGGEYVVETIKDKAEPVREVRWNPSIIDYLSAYLGEEAQA